MSQQFLVPLLVKSGTAVIDVGANLGQLTIPIARLVGSKGIVHAFEPITQNHLKLEKTIEKEKLVNRINLYKLGLSNLSSVEVFTIPKDRYTEATLIPHKVQDWSNFNSDKSKYIEEKCELTTLDDFIASNQINNISFIKCDVEGAEYLVLQGAKKLLKSKNPPVLLLEIYEEWTKDFGYHPRDLLQFLKSEGNYDFYWISEGGLVPVTPDDEKIPGIFYEWVDFICIIPEIHGKYVKLDRFLA